MGAWREARTAAGKPTLHLQDRTQAAVFALRERVVPLEELG